MKPAPPVTRIRRLAWITQQFGTDDQDPETREPGKATRRGRRSGDGDRALTWKNLEKRSGEGVGGGREVVCSPSRARPSIGLSAAAACPHQVGDATCALIHLSFRLFGHV